jgi:hypothetical protein
MVQLSSIVQSLGIAEAAGVKEQIKDFMSARPASDVTGESDASGMEVDEDLVRLANLPPVLGLKNSTLIFRPSSPISKTNLLIP